MSISIGIGRIEEHTSDKGKMTSLENWKLLKTFQLDSNNAKLIVNKDEEGNDFNCTEIIIVGKIVSNASSKPMCKLNNSIEFSGVNSTFTNGTKYIYDKYTLKGFFIERDMKSLNQDILENSVLFDNGFLRVVKEKIQGINSIEIYGDSSSFMFKAGTELEVYGH